jgi:hypothetical protein
MLRRLSRFVLEILPLALACLIGLFLLVDQVSGLRPRNTMKSVPASAADVADAQGLLR